MCLRLFCPGLFGPLDLPPWASAPVPALDRLLERADTRRPEAPGPNPRDPFRTLARAFGLVPPPGTDLPSASLCAWVEIPDAEASQCWYHADPVHLHADRDRLLLFAGPGLEVGADESADLVDSFNRHFSGDGLMLVAPRPDHWYLRVERVPDLVTWPLHEVVGRAVDAFLPRGADAGAWMRWQTEAQMLFHAHPVNAGRERTGRPVLGGLWTWGGGSRPVLSPGGPDCPDGLVADHPLALGLARWAGLDPELVFGLGQWNGAPDGRRAGRRGLVCWDRAWWPALTGDLDAWLGAVAALEPLAQGLSADLRTGVIGSLRIQDGLGLDLQIRRRALGRFWRRRGGLLERVQRSGPAG